MSKQYFYTSILILKHFLGFIAHVNEFHQTEFQCSDGSVPKFYRGGFDKVVAVLGGQSSAVTLQVSFKIVICD